MARIQSTSESFRIATQNTMEGTQKLLVRVAKREHGRIMAADPQPKSFTRFVDGRQGAAEEAVKANGVILYQYPRLDVVAQFAMETLFDLSPVRSGEYRMSHTLFLNGVAVANLAGWNPGDEVSITNLVPYSRKIEVGNMTMRVPGSSRVYQQARRVIMSRYGNVAGIEFTYRGIASGAVITGRAGNKADLRFPVLVIRER
jgi:hypothetical protein